MKEMVMSEAEILAACKRIGAELTERLKDEKRVPLFVCVMRGAMNFMADLMKYIKTDILVDYVQVRSMCGTKSTGVVHFDRDVTIDVKDRVIVLVEDVVDTGITMRFLKQHFAEMSPKDVLIASLLDKRADRACVIEADYVGKTLNEKTFVVGYGLDYRDMVRNTPYIYIPDEDEIKAWDEKISQ